jgi:hypothetical protein
MSVDFNAKKVRAATALLAPFTSAAPKKYGAKVSVTLARSGSVEFFVDRVKPGHVKNGRCRSLSARASKGRAACKRYMSFQSRTTIELPGGTSAVYFTGRMAGKQLDAGKYRLRAAVGSLTAKTRVFSLTH